MERLTERDKYGGALLKAGTFIPDVIDRLCEYEDIGFEPEELAAKVYLVADIPEEKLSEIKEAMGTARLVIKPEPLLDTCGTCMHFQREGNTAHGHCDCRINKYLGYPLYVVQSRKRCRDDYLSIRGREDRT